MPWDVVVASDSDPREVLGLAPDAPFPFRGPLPFALNQATNNLTAPEAFLRNSLVRDRYFFTLPRNLWDAVYRRMGESTFDQAAASLEVTLAQICGDHTSNAGLFRGIAFPYYSLVRLAPPCLRVEDLGLSITQADLDRQLRIADERISGLWTTAQGYLGWLLTCPMFLDEHDALIRDHASVIGRWGTAAFGQPLPPPHFDLAPGSEQAAFRAANVRFVEFFNRWRLLGLAAPYLPVPMQPQFAGSLPETMLHRYSEVGGLFVVPDTFPVPSRDEFRGLLDDALHGSPPDHLDAWMRIVAAGNTGRQSITRNARIFVLQHFWRVLHHRHCRPLRRQTGELKRAFAEFLQADEQAIHRDSMEIRRRLGRDWLDRGAGSPVGPF